MRPVWPVRPVWLGHPEPPMAEAPLRPEVARLPMLTEVVAEGLDAPVLTAVVAELPAPSMAVPATPWPRPAVPAAPPAALVLPVLTESLDALLAPLSEGPLPTPSPLSTASPAESSEPLAAPRPLDPGMLPGAVDALGAAEWAGPAQGEPQMLEPETVEPETVEPQSVEPQTVEPGAVEPPPAAWDAAPSWWPAPIEAVPVDETTPAPESALTHPTPPPEPVAPVAVAGAAVRRPVDDAALVDAVVRSVQPRLDDLVDQRLREVLLAGLAPALQAALQQATEAALQQALAAWLPEARALVHTTLREVVAQAVAEETARAAGG